MRLISENKMKHSISVARFMQKYAVERLLSEEFAEELFILGYLHDIGEEFTSNKVEHNKAGGNILRSQKYKYWKEVYYHGEAQTEYTSAALQILNLAELCISSDGTYVGIDARLKMLKEKFGENSLEYLNTCAQAKIVRETKIAYKK